MWSLLSLQWRVSTLSRLTILFCPLYFIYLIPHVSYTFLSTVAVHRLDVAQETSVEFA